MRVLACLVLAAALTPARAQIPTDGLSTFKDGAQRFSVRFPADWPVTDLSDPTSCFFASSGLAGGAADRIQVLSVTCEANGPGDPLDTAALLAAIDTDEGLTAFLDGIASSTDEVVEPVGHRAARVAGRDALRFTYVQTIRTAGGGVPLYSVIHLFGAPTTSFTLVCGETDGDRAATDAACDRLARTFSLGAGASVAVPAKPR